MKKLTLLFTGFTFSCCILNAQTGIITTVAGTGTAGYNGDARLAITAEINQDGGVTVDATGNIYIADSQNNRIRKVSTTGNITTIAGRGTAGYSGNGGQATAAELAYPVGVRVDTLGNVYFSDAGNALIRKISVAGVITNIAGIPGVGGYSGNGAIATAAELNYPVGICVDKNLDIYVADQNNNVIRKITAGTNIITTYAGNHVAGFAGNGGQATAARLNNPIGVAIDRLGNLYIADYNNSEVRKVTAAGVISDFAGTNVANFNGYSGLADTTRIANPTGVSTDAAGNVYIADAGNALIREVIASTGQMYVIAGTLFDGYSGDGGAALSAEINYPFDVFTDKTNNVYIADLSNNRVRKITAGCAIDTTTAAVYNYPSCNGSNDGVVIAFSNSPFQPLSYSWTPSGNTNQEVTGLTAGIYAVTIKDAVGCSVTSSITLTQPTEISGQASIISDVNCFGSHDGILSASATGGEPPYNYSWIPTGGNGAVASGLAAGTYTVTIGDYTGCSTTASVIITQPASVPTISISNKTDVTCFGGSGGAATANMASGGTSPYLYSWSGGGGNNLTATGLSSGVYIVTANDNLGCTATAEVTITQPSALAITIGNQTNVTCFGGTGSATANAATGGTAPYLYSWSGGGGNNLNITGLTPGADTITVTDINGCMASASVNITQPGALTANTTINSNINCNGNSDGSASVSASGGTGAYTYAWAPSGGNAETANGLQADTYTVTVTDNNGCNITVSVIITEPVALTITQDSTTQTSTPCNGVAEVLTNGGTSPYTYLWATGGQTTASITGQCAGYYCCEVTDNDGCSISTCVTVNFATGIDNINPSAIINIYPDPNNGFFTIVGVGEGHTIEVYNNMGQKVSSSMADNNEIQVDISNRPNGIYLIRIVDKGGNLIGEKKIVTTK